MADKDSKVPENVPGKYYVDTSCINCGTCIEDAPENFEEGDEFTFVSKQPGNDEEAEACESAMEGCSVEAIGNDGDS